MNNPTDKRIFELHAAVCRAFAHPKRLIVNPTATITTKATALARMTSTCSRYWRPARPSVRASAPSTGRGMADRRRTHYLHESPNVRTIRA